MNLIIVHSVSKNKRSLKIAKKIDGDLFEIKHIKEPIKMFVLQLIFYGYQTVRNSTVGIKPHNINFDKYSDIYLVSPIWAGRMNAYMRQFLINNTFKNKNIHIIGSCRGGYKNYFKSFTKFLDKSNKIVEESIYVKDKKIK